MTEGDITPALTDPASVMLGLAALCSIFAAGFWWRFASVSGDIATANGSTARRRLGHAATFTAAAMLLGGVGYLVGRFAGSL